MWTRNRLKTNAKAAFQRNYWHCVLIALLVAVVLGSLGSGFRWNINVNGETVSQHAFRIAFDSAAIVLLLRIFVLTPFEVGAAKFFTDNACGDAHVEGVLAGFTGNYIRNVLALFLRDLFIGLWSLLLVIPGIVKAYAYRLVPYILADHPDMGAKEALDMSSRMMRGHKWRVFVLDLSFLGWAFLSLLTFGILALFYVNPYVQATQAELYLALREGA